MLFWMLRRAFWNDEKRSAKMKSRGAASSGWGPTGCCGAERPQVRRSHVLCGPQNAILVRVRIPRHLN